jgi:ABC-type dipeptide/oligopeptide/nickel transport system permease subunit
MVEPGTPAGLTSASPIGGRAFLIVGGVGVVGGVIVGLVASAFVGWTNSVCSDTTAVVAQRQHGLRVILLAVWVLVAAVPGAWAVIARTLRRNPWPWATLSVVLVAVALVLATTARPSTWCLY